ncbi:hypothetical protein KUTeg_015268 [Tegillarca granosa]|uniref:HD domain-containing protein n=1 Tax=Tegillarca granosa TaxID=220873 RepID=A0ABQ9EQB3_TEGGR|nr:hypothetical protein KUTeg_015268 [Tegillarca granosa]
MLKLAQYWSVDILKYSNADVIIADPIHGMMIFEPYLVKIINHPYFQRLRHIKQLQGVEHVYPGGVHSRFSHSLGVCFLAGKVLDHLEKLIETEKTKYKISNFERKCVEISALCHDIDLYFSVVNLIDLSPTTLLTLSVHDTYYITYANLIILHIKVKYLQIENSNLWIFALFQHEARSVEIAKTIIDDLCLFENKKERKFAKKVIGEMIQVTKVVNNRRFVSLIDQNDYKFTLKDFKLKK